MGGRKSPTGKRESFGKDEGGVLVIIVRMREAWRGVSRLDLHGRKKTTKLDLSDARLIR